ncbi:long-chain acyl-CoA synthetase [Tistlia consotensis]|uniref:Long-chain-fatty-acid--CoA ligase n=1 Tax=Tistlia consotensis USBA 355 TaxID=560819 RepID=A0A1Y6BCJ2_9PROT|nr:dicarboxylate--CoA ligase PimA [Tistlia consotensis]SMF04244.1 long-chain acyl-CoA synthetase [Tistlia consotensis USBA 355]SNR54358.1 long-chain acyl-CoA synthetase [Tistlia consotensis]
MSARPFVWEKAYPPGLSWDHPIATGLVTALLDEAAREAGARTALYFRSWRCSYAELKQRADRLAAGLLAEGLDREQCIALYLPNSPCHPVAFFGGLRTGARLTHLSPLDAPRELAYKLRDSGARTVITTNLGGLLAGAVKLLEAGLVDRVIVGDDAAFGEPAPEREAIPARPEVIPLDRLAETCEPPANWPQIDPADTALLQYTGGTTGLPKAAILSHANLTAAVSIYDAWFKALYPENRGWERVICALPLFHIYALTTILLRGVRRHSEIILHLRFDAGQVLQDVEQKRATAFPGVPTMWIALLNHPDLGKRDLSSLDRCSSGGAPLPVEVGRRFEEATGRRLAGGWGLTETAPAGTNLLPFGEPRPGSIGIPLPGVEVRVVALDEPARALPPGEVGELAVRGPNVTAGYWNRPEETAATFAGGYLLTGDVGYMAEDGFFYLVDRKKDLIISGGFNVYPQMVEQAIYEHPAVQECIVVGIPDPYRGEAAKAFVTLKPAGEPFTLEALQAFLADKLGRHEIPRALEFRETLPRTAVGKLSRRALREEERLTHAGPTEAAGPAA